MARVTALTVAGLAYMAAGCQLYVGPPVAHGRMEGGGWGAVTDIPKAAYVNPWSHIRSEYRSSAMAVRCGVWPEDPLNTVEVDVYSFAEVESEVRIDLHGDGAPAKGVTGAYRRSDGQWHWYPDRKFRPWRSGAIVTVPPRGSVHVLVPSSTLFGHFPPRSGDSFTIACEFKSGDGVDRVDGSMIIEDVTREKGLDLLGH